MITLESMPFAAGEIPVEKVFEFNGANYRFQILWNEEGEFYALKIADQAGDDLYAVKLVYGFNVIRATIEGLSLRAKIVLVDPADLTSEIPVRNSIARTDLGQAAKVYVFRDG